jgi:hypothetical protein
LGFREGYRQNIALIGQEGVGKTSLILHFLKGLNDTRLLPVYIDIQKDGYPEAFVRRFVGRLLYNFLRNSQIELEENLEFLIEKSRRFIPETAEKAKGIISSFKKRKAGHGFGEIMSLCEIITRETQKSCVVILDEFQHLEAMRFKNLYKEWSKLLVSRKDIMFIVISSARFKAKKILSEKLSLLFGNFQVIEIEPFCLKTSEQFLADRLKELKLNKTLIDFLIHFSGGFPFYLEIVSDQILKSIINNKDGLWNQDLLTHMLEELLFKEAGILNQRFSNYLKPFWQQPDSRQDYISILYSIANGHNLIKDITHVVRRQKKDILTKVNRLVELDILCKNGDFYRINDRIFGFWLKFVSQDKNEALNLDARTRQQTFRKRIELMIEEFVMDSHKPLIERATELLRLFRNEAVYLDRKRLRLLHFREIKPLRFKRKHINQGIICRSNDALWIIAIKKDIITEEDIAEFSRECKKYRHQRMQNKVIITATEGINTNAHLKALEEKILTWDLSKLNLLFDLFNKPRVIL